MKKVYLEPYNITSPHLQRINDTTFINPDKYKHIYIVTRKEESPKILPDSTLLHQEDFESYSVRWYETKEKGREYTVIPSPCGVYISSFENGFTSTSEYDAAIFGSAFFCFGRIYLENGDEYSTHQSEVNFEFDGHYFSCTGTEINNSGAYDCDKCNNAPIDTYNNSKNNEVIMSSSNQAPPILDPVIPSISTFAESTTEGEVCPDGEQSVSKEFCESQNNPDIAVSPSGSAIVAYEHRDKLGNTIIKIRQFCTTHSKNIVYYRSLSFGKLINTQEEQPTLATFEVYDDIETSDVSILGIGFINGPLSGKGFNVTKQTRSEQSNGLPVHSLEFSLGSTELVFPDANDINDIQWFLTDESSVGTFSQYAMPTEKDHKIYTFATQCYDISINSTVEDDLLHAARFNIMSFSVARILKSIEMTFNVPTLNCNIHWYVMESAPGGVDNWQVISTSVTRPSQVGMVSHNSGNIYTNLKPGPSIQYAVGCAIDYPRVIFSKESNGSQYIDDSIKATIIGSRILRMIPPFISGEYGWLLSTALLLDKYEMGLCFDDSYSGTMASPPDGTYETGWFQIGDPQSDISDDFEFTFCGNWLYASGAKYIPDKITWINKFEQKLLSTAGQKLYFIIFEYAEDSKYSVIHSEVIVADTDLPKMYSSSDINIELIPSQKYYFGVSVRSNYTKFYKSVTGGVKLDFLHHGYYGNENIRMYPPPTGLWSYMDYTMGTLYVQRLLLGTNTDVDQKLLGCSTEWQSLGYSTTPDVPTTNRYRGNTIYVASYPSSSPDYKTVTLKNFRVYIDVPAEVSNPVLYFYIMERTSGTTYNIVWSSGAKTLSEANGTGFSNWVKASDTDDINIEFTKPSIGARQWSVGVAWGDESISTSLIPGGSKKHLTFPCFIVAGSISYVFSPPFIGSPSLGEYNSNLLYAQEYYIEYENEPLLETGCCAGGGECYLLTQDQCESLGWTSVPNSDCDTANCIPEPKGACCLAPTFTPYYIPSSCIPNVTQSQCHAYGVNSTYMGDGTSCVSSTCLAGACCSSDYSTCTDVPNRSSCMSVGGIWKWAGSKCSELSFWGEGCLSDTNTGSCCVKSDVAPGGCLDISENDCTSLYGSISSGWSPLPCSQVNCLSIGYGSCCYGDAQCVIANQIDCATIYHSNVWNQFGTCEVDSVTGTSGGCPHRGACCFSENSGPCLDDFTPIECAAQGGDYRGNGVSCLNYSCEDARGACCEPCGNCEENVTQLGCADILGIYQGNDTTCSGITCTPRSGVGACCLEDGTCQILSIDDCIVRDGLYQGDCTECNTSNCPIKDMTNEEALDLPCHTYNNECVASVHPSIDIAYNNIMIDRSEYISIAYQAFEDNQWNVYLRQIRTVYKDKSDPVYKSPYNLLSNPSFTLSKLEDSTYSKVEYEVIGRKSVPTEKICAIFKVSLTNGSRVYNCNSSAGVWTTNCTYDIQLDKTEVFVEAEYICLGSESPGFWSIGTKFTGSYPPTASILGVNNSNCIDQIILYPDLEDWCYLQSNCVQTNLIDDAFCTSPYLGLTYKAEDMWILEASGQKHTRVKYHCAVNVIDITSETVVSGQGIGGQIDFMFVVDYSGSMAEKIAAVRSEIAPFALNLSNAGLDVRFGLCIFGRGEPAPGDPDTPPIAITCSNPTSVDDTHMFDGLYGFADGGFTDSVKILSDALNYWNVSSAQAPGYSAIQYVSLDDTTFKWRDTAKRYIMLITDASNSENEADCNSEGYSNDEASAISVITSNNTLATVIVAICDNVNTDNVPPPVGIELCSYSGLGYVNMSLQSGWDQSEQYFDVRGPYNLAFQSIVDKITQDITLSTVVERDKSGYLPTFLKPAEIIITYSGDLTDIWTQEKNLLSFIDSVPTTTGTTKGLVNMPYPISYSNIYGIDPVHLNGDWTKWVYFQEPGPIRIDRTSPSNIGVPNISQSNPRLISNNAINPKVAFNNRNDIFVAYETLEFGVNQIAIRGTGDFAQDSITGPKGSRITKFTSSSDFFYEHLVTLPGEGVNQICDMAIDKNDVIHLVWQSNRDGYWEIYYANGKNSFDPVRVTKCNSRSGHPSIDIDNSGYVYVVYHDNRYGVYEIMLSSKRERRIIPLLQQDAYLAGLRSGYEHHTNILPILLSNPTSEVPSPGKMWGTKIQCSDVIIQIVLNYTLDGTTDTNIHPFNSRNDINQLGGSDFPNEGNYFYVEIWANTTLSGGLYSASIALSYDPDFFEDITTYEHNSLYTDWDFGGLGYTPSVNEVTGIIENIGGAQHSSIQSGEIPYYTRVGTVRMKVKNKPIPGDTVIFRTAGTFDPSIGSGYVFKDSNGNEIEDSRVQYDTLSITSSISTGKVCLNDVNNIFDINANVPQLGVDTSNGTLVLGGGELQNSYKISAIAGSVSGNTYGITESGLLLLLSQPSEDPYLVINVNNIKEVGYINLSLDNYDIVGAAIDTLVFHLWVCLAGSDGGVGNVIVVEVDPTNADIIRESTVYSNIDMVLGKYRASLACTSGGQFHLITYRDGKVVFSSASFPSFSGPTAIFDFNDIIDDMNNDVNFASEDYVSSMTSDYNDTIFIVTNRENAGGAGDGSDNSMRLFDIDRTTGSMHLIGSVSDPEAFFDRDGVMLLSEIGALGYQFSGRMYNIGSAGYFQVLLEFFDNKNAAAIGSNETPEIIIDSRYNTEAFLSDQSVEEDAYFASARGVYLNSGASGYLFFDASHYRPGYNNLSYPYGFDTNKAYFVRAKSIDSTGAYRDIETVQEVTFSCNKCTRLGDNSFDSGGCSYSFTVTNNSNEDRYYNFQVLFYADEDRESIIRIFNLSGENEDLQFAEVDNKQATDEWDSLGLYIKTGDVKFIQIYPALDPTAGFLCGISYYMRVLSCFSNTGGCTDYNTSISDSEWNSIEVPDTLINNRAVSVASIEDNLSIAWVSASQPNVLKYGVFDGIGWAIEEVANNCGGDIYLASINGNPAIAFDQNEVNHIGLAYAWKEDGVWNIVELPSSDRTGSMPILREWNYGPAIAYWLGDNNVEFAFSGSGFVWSTEKVKDLNDTYDGFFQFGFDIIGEIPTITMNANADGRNCFYLTRDSDGNWSSNIIKVSGYDIRNCKLVEYQGNPIIVYQRGINVQSNSIYWATSTDGGISWTGSIIEESDSSAANIELVNGKPFIVYTTGLVPYHMKYARFINTSKWEVGFIHSDMSIPEDYSDGDPLNGLKSIADYESQAFVFPSINTMRVYYPNSYNTLNGISSKYFCDCGSNIFDTDQKLLPLSEMNRWESSAHGYSDTRVTDSPNDSLRPDIRVRRRGSAVISFEDYNNNATEIRQSTFQTNRDPELLGSGSRSWFDFKYQVSGKNVSTYVDINDAISSTYERRDAQQESNIPSDSIYVNNFNIDDSVSSIVDSSTSPIDTTCNITSFTDNILTTDPFLSKYLVKKILVKEEFVDYFTYTTSGKEAPVVSVCEIKLEIWGTPEVIALRIKNENDSEWGSWCPWRPEKGDYHTEVDHKLSLGSGNKEVCVQAILYNGITAQFCTNIIADYKKIFFELKMYSDEDRTIILPKYNGLFVAALDSASSDGEFSDSRTVYVDIIPNQPVLQNNGGCDGLVNSINFDVVQQGVGDKLDLTAIWDCSGDQIFRGKFEIFKEDNIINTDGLARLRVKIPGECDEVTSGGFFVTSEFTKDIYNRMSDTSQAAISEEEGDALELYRQEISGRIGTGVVLRPSSDPYLVFGNPDYFFQNKETENKGIYLNKDGE